MIFANLEHARHRRQIVTAPKTCGAQILAHGIERRVQIVGDFAQVDAPALKSTVVIQGKPRDFGHEVKSTCDAPPLGRAIVTIPLLPLVTYIEPSSHGNKGFYGKYKYVRVSTGLL